MTRSKIALAAFLSSAFLVIASTAALSAAAPQLPKATLEDLKKVKLDPSILSDIDKELTVPQGWTDGAKKERHLRIFSTFDPPQADALMRAFKERYPYIAIEYNRASHEDRAIRTLVAYKNKKSVTDILTGLGGSFFMYREIGAMENLKNIPNVKNNPPGTFDPEGFWVGMHMRYWCMAYNTKQIGKADVPKKWEDFLANPKWRNGNLALGNRPQLWALQLWDKKGEKWLKDFLTKLFNEAKPQLRREGMNAMLELLAAGEFYGSIPSAEYRTYQKTLDGAPVNYTCPEPAPGAVSEMAILKGSPNINAARLFVNWFLSKEGQIAQYVADYAPPVHKALQRKELLPFADQIVGKEIAFRDPILELEVQPKLLEFWDELWLKGGGRRRGK
ncbi:MAG TPA: extracellular solute-binding protein [Candidatus Binatia bacterium]|jgi:iron(III) transport system substrate-binding protein